MPLLPSNIKMSGAADNSYQLVNGKSKLRARNPQKIDFFFHLM